MSFLRAQKIIFASIVSILLAGTAWATPISDNYVGATDSLNRDVIGHHDQFDINGADVQRVGDELRVRVFTNFAGLADNGLYSGYTSGNKGIGYGDLFLAPSWNPHGNAPYLDDDYSNGTTWTHAFSLENRWSDSGGAGFLFKLNPQAKDSQILLSDEFITGASYRNGQEVAVEMNSGALLQNGSWSVGDSDLDSDSVPDYIQFIINLSGVDTLLTSDYIAFHWTMTCGNDVIEGHVPNSVPEPSSVLLLGLGLLGVAGMGRMKLKKK